MFASFCGFQQGKWVPETRNPRQLGLYRGLAGLDFGRIFRPRLPVRATKRRAATTGELLHEWMIAAFALRKQTGGSGVGGVSGVRGARMGRGEVEREGKPGVEEQMRGWLPDSVIHQLSILHGCHPEP
jgi:hypothetical protein